MSIAKRVSEAINKMEAADPEAALFAICAALDSTSKGEAGQSHSGRQCYMGFIDQNMWLITDIAFAGRRVLNLNLAYSHPDIKADSQGRVSVQQIFYHAVRCGLYHDSKLPSDLQFEQANVIRVDSGKLVLPASLIHGLIMAVVLSPFNKSETTAQDHVCNIGSLPLPINQLWGRREEMKWLLGALAEMVELQKRCNAGS